jgi:hypothetical protein
MARLFHALGEKVCVTRKTADEISFEMIPKLRAVDQHWQWAKPKPSTTAKIRVDDRLGAVIKDTGASNDNYDDRFVLIDTELELEAA